MGIVWFPQFDKVLGIRESDGAICLTGDVVLTPGNVTSILANTGDALLESANVFTRGQTITQGTANESILTSTGFSVTGANTTSLMSLAGTWNTSGAATGILLSITNTQSGSASKLLDLKVDTTTLFDILKSGEARASYLTILSGGYLNLNASTGTSILTAGDGSGTISQRSGTTEQQFNVYGTYTNASNYERLAIYASGGAGGYFNLKSQQAGTGVRRSWVLSGQEIFFNTGSDATRWNINGSGHLLTGTDNAVDIGASGATRPRAIYVAGLANIGGVLTAASATATPANGSTSACLLLGTTAAFGIYYGSGAPTVSAAQGSLYLRSDGSSTSTRAYINTNGTTGWTAITTAT